MFERFTEMARQVVVMAQEQARSLHHNHIGTEHLLFGLVVVEREAASEVLKSLGVTEAIVREKLIELGDLGAGETHAGQIPFTPRAKRSLEMALREALALGHDYVGTAHLLLGLAKSEESTGMRILRASGLGEDQVRSAVVAWLSGPKTRVSPRDRGAPSQHESGAGDGGHMLRLAVGADSLLNRLLIEASIRARAAERPQFGLVELLDVTLAHPEARPLLESLLHPEDQPDNDG